MVARLRRAVTWYDGRLKAAPLRTKIFTSFTILTSADILRQAFFEAPALQEHWDTDRPPQLHRGFWWALKAGPIWWDERFGWTAPPLFPWWDGERTARMAIFSCSLHPVWIHHWFNFLEHWRPSAPLTAPPTTVLRVAMIKTAIDQFASVRTPTPLSGYSTPGR